MPVDQGKLPPWFQEMELFRLGLVLVAQFACSAADGEEMGPGDTTDVGVVNEVFRVRLCGTSLSQDVRRIGFATGAVGAVDT